MKKLTYLAALWLLSGCYTSKRATEQVVKAQAYYPEIVASMCGNLYPPIELMRDSIVYKQGETTYSHDTVVVDCDSVISIPGQPRTVKLPCPPCPKRVDTFYVTKTQVQVNRAKEQALDAEVASLNKALVKADTKATWFMWLFIIIGVYTLARIITNRFKIRILP